MGLWSFWSVSLFACVFLNPFHSKFVAQAEISSLKTNDRFYRLEVNQLEALVTRESTEVKVDSSTKVLSAFQSREVDALKGKQVEKETRGLEHEALIGNKTALNCLTSPTIPGKKCNNISEDNQGRPTANIVIENSFPDTRKRVKRGLSTPYAENVDRSIQGEAQSTERFVETVQGVSSSRPEYRRTGDEGRGSNPRQSEPHLDTSTFALSGDSAHNQAMVHWSGHNSSNCVCFQASEIQSSVVILILTKLYDFNLGAVTESSLWRSSDYGSTYSKLNDKVGSRTVLSYLYVCPTNKQKIMMLSDPEVESAVLISSDEGTSFEKYPINFNILSLLFHPAQENWILAYSHDGKLYSSMDFGRKWQLVHDNVMPGRFYWAVMGLDRESDVVHIETRIAKGRAQYVKCRAQRCTEGNKLYLFPGYVDTNSMVVQDEYVFTQVTKSGRASYFVSYMRESFKRMKLPKYCLPKDMHIISTDEKQVFAAVQEWNQNNTYSLYISDSPGVYFTLSLENLRTSRGPAGNLLVDFYKVEGINGMYLANKLLDSRVKTFITYNKGQTWALLPAPAADVAGNNLHCILPFCSLHLHLEMSENPYTSGPITSKKSVPGIIVATGNIGTELSSTNLGMFITSDAGNSWRQIFDEEHNVWFLDNGGALLAVLHSPTPIRHLWISLDEGKKWDRHSFSLAPLYVDGVLMEPESDNHIITFFGHFSHRSEWQLIKIDYKGLFSRRCMDGDYQTWQLHNKGELCVMGEKQIYMKRRPGNRCMLAQDYSRIYSSEPCLCTADYGWERQTNGMCSPAFWFNPNGVAKSCSTSQSFLNSTGYRKVLSNNCKEAGRNVYSPKRQACRPRPPRGLQLSTSHGELSSTVGSNVTFMLYLDDGDSLRTSIQLDFGDGIKIIYSNLSRTDDGISHIYRATGIYRPIITLEGSVSYTFQKGGNNKVTVQVASGSIILQDSKVVTVKEFFRSLLLSFSPALDEHNPDIPEWREDIGRVVRSALSQVSGVSEDQLLVSLYPGLPSTAELFILPDELTSTENRKGGEEALDRISDIFVTALNQGVIQFELKADIRIVVYMTQQTLAPLVDSNSIHSGSAMLLLLTVVLVGLGAFFIYKFKRKIPWIHVQTEDSREKDPEVISTVGQNDNMSKVKLSEFPSPKELMEKELEARSSGGIGRNMERIVTREFPNCTNV
ncbi:VPS10 domain containing receptor SorCS3 [Dissostichus eleginoides]|uniref:VPS10 domain containing receptor SorCS3 n=1 Tax=Dissostichus eleginoides TaxID=100907 RepID=A0AAD9FN69_DISEL|nr:VPS10 domain containing receptor SorCS3 [Dissostichus eleginoides]